MKKVNFLLLTLFFLTASYSQNCSICAEALKRGTKDEFYHETKSSFDESVNTMYSYDFEFWEKYSSSNNRSASLDAAYKIFSLSFSSNSSSSEKREIFNKQKSTYIYSRTVAQQLFEKISQSLISKIPYETFTSCIKSTCDNGISVNAETSGNDIIITVTWIVTSDPGNRQAKLKTVPTVANATPLDYNFTVGTILKPFNSISGLYRRNNPNDDAIFSFDFEGFPTTPFTVKRSNYENTLLPVGSTVASDLDYATFCSINNIPSTGDNAELIWVPADGRTVTGSNYGRKKSTVPDYRGTFLRGLNVFDPSNNLPFNRIGQKDPQNRNVNDLQDQSVGPHKHPIEDPGHAHAIAKGMTGDSWGGRFIPSGQGDDGCDHCAEKNTTLPNQTGIIIKENDGSETRPTNVAVYYYIKIN